MRNRGPRDSAGRRQRRLPPRLAHLYARPPPPALCPLTPRPPTAGARVAVRADPPSPAPHSAGAETTLTAGNLANPFPPGAAIVVICGSYASAISPPEPLRVVRCELQNGRKKP